MDIVRRAAPAGCRSPSTRSRLANREALDAFEKTRRTGRRTGSRHRIEHAQLLHRRTSSARRDRCDRSPFRHSPRPRLADRFWAGKPGGAYAYRSLWESGAVVVNGSDAPIEELDPLAGIRAGVLRTLDDRPPWHPEQTLSVEQVFHATCVTPAWLSYDEHRRGKLIPGYLADMVVLDRDPFDLEPEQLADVQVVSTMVGGRWVHNPPPWD